MIYYYRVRPRGLEDGNLSAFVSQLPRFILYFSGSQTCSNRYPNHGIDYVLLSSIFRSNRS